MKRVYARYLEIRHEDAEAIEERSDIHFNAGVAYFYTGDFRRAIALYSEIRVSPDFHGYYANRGSAQAQAREAPDEERSEAADPGAAPSERAREPSVPPTSWYASMEKSRGPSFGRSAASFGAVRSVSPVRCASAARRTSAFCGAATR